MKKYILIFLTIFCCGFRSQSKNTQEPDTYAYTRGVEAYAQENYADALEWFNRELSDHPQNGYAQVYIAILRYGNQEYGKALSSIDGALKNLPKKDMKWRSLGYVTRAEIYTAMEDTVRALNDLTQAIKIDPKNSKFYDTRAQIYYEQKNYTQSDADYRQMINLDAGDVVGYMGIGRNAQARKNWDEALDQFNYVIKLAPDYSSGYSFRAETYSELEKWNEATDDIVKALDIDGDQKAFYLMQNLPDEATALLKSKLKIQQAKQPSNRYWPYCIAVIANKKKSYEEAIEFYQQANKLDANSLFLENIAQCYMHLQDYNNALDFAEQALSMNPDDYDVISLKADILARLGRFDECLVERDKYVARYPEYVVSYLSRADDLMNARKYKEAIEDYNTAVVLVPAFKDYPYLLMKRGDAYRFTGNKELADADYNALLKAEQDSPLSDESWTPFAYSGLGNQEKAIETMLTIIANDSIEDVDNLYNLACIYSRTGNADKALETLRKALNNGYKEYGQIATDYDLDILRDKPEFNELIQSFGDNNRTGNTDEGNDAGYTFEKVEVPFTKDGGVTKVKCTINGLPLHFVFDTGAADVTMSMVEANFMLKNDYIKPSDIIGSARYVDANGDISEGTIINLRNVNFGGLELDNVRASVVRNQKAPLLLGQSVLGRLGKIEIDNPGMKLIITHKVSK